MDATKKSPTAIIDDMPTLRAEDARSRIVNRLPAMIGYWNRELRCEFANDAYIEWFGLSPPRVIGIHMKELLGEHLFRLNEPFARMALSGQEQRFEREIRKPDGTTGITDARYIPDPDQDGNIRGFFVLVSDVTNLHRAHARVRELLTRLESAREDERRSLSGTLHEGIAQDLFAITLRLDQLRAHVADHGMASELCQELTEATTKCMVDIRQVANDLRPAALTYMRLKDAIEEHAIFFGRLTGLKIRVKEVEPLPNLEEKLRLFLFRAAQEALTNVARHAKASTVDIILRAEATRISVIVVDDGTGISNDALEKPGSLGLLGLRERAQGFGGDLSVAKNTSAGAMVSVHVRRP
jgi:PAS domain S-box-containing protein